MAKNTKMAKKYQNGHKNTKIATKCTKIAIKYQMSMAYTKCFIPGHTKIGDLGHENIPSGNPGIDN
jgi:hypothetical protein